MRRYTHLQKEPLMTIYPDNSTLLPKSPADESAQKHHELRQIAEGLLPDMAMSILMVQVPSRKSHTAAWTKR